MATRGQRMHVLLLVLVAAAANSEPLSPGTTATSNLPCMAQYRGPLLHRQGRKTRFANVGSNSAADCAWLCDTSANGKGVACQSFSFRADARKCWLFTINNIVLDVDLVFNVLFDHYYTDPTCRGDPKITTTTVSAAAIDTPCMHARRYRGPLHQRQGKQIHFILKRPKASAEECAALCTTYVTTDGAKGAGCESFSYRADAQKCWLFSVNSIALGVDLVTNVNFKHYYADPTCSAGLGDSIRTTATTRAQPAAAAASDLPCMAQYRGPLLHRQGRKTRFANVGSDSAADCAWLCDTSANGKGVACQSFSFRADARKCWLFTINSIVLDVDLVFNVLFDHYYTDPACLKDDTGGGFVTVIGTTATSTRAAPVVLLASVCAESTWLVSTFDNDLFNMLCSSPYTKGADFTECDAVQPFSTASSRCAQKGGRMCTLQELEKRAGNQTPDECGINAKFSWTIDTCIEDVTGLPGHIIAKTSNGMRSSCKADVKKARVMCCGDNEAAPKRTITTTTTMSQTTAASSTTALVTTATKYTECPGGALYNFDEPLPSKKRKSASLVTIDNVKNSSDCGKACNDAGTKCASFVYRGSNEKCRLFENDVPDGQLADVADYTSFYYRRAAQTCRTMSSTTATTTPTTTFTSITRTTSPTTTTTPTTSTTETSTPTTTMSTSTPTTSATATPSTTATSTTSGTTTLATTFTSTPTSTATTTAFVGAFKCVAMDTGVGLLVAETSERTTCNAQVAQLMHILEVCPTTTTGTIMCKPHSNVENVLTAVGMAGKINKNNCATYKTALNYAIAKFLGPAGNSLKIQCYRGALRSSLDTCHAAAEALNMMTETFAQGRFQQCGFTTPTTTFTSTQTTSPTTGETTSQTTTETVTTGTTSATTSETSTTATTSATTTETPPSTTQTTSPATTTTVITFTTATSTATVPNYRQCPGGALYNFEEGVSSTKRKAASLEVINDVKHAYDCATECNKRTGACAAFVFRSSNKKCRLFDHDGELSDVDDETSGYYLRVQTCRTPSTQSATTKTLVFAGLKSSTLPTTSSTSGTSSATSSPFTTSTKTSTSTTTTTLAEHYISNDASCNTFGYRMPKSYVECESVMQHAYSSNFAANYGVIDCTERSFPERFGANDAHPRDRHGAPTCFIRTGAPSIYCWIRHTNTNKFQDGSGDNGGKNTETLNDGDADIDGSGAVQDGGNGGEELELGGSGDGGGDDDGENGAVRSNYDAGSSWDVAQLWDASSTWTSTRALCVRDRSRDTTSTRTSTTTASTTTTLHSTTPFITGTTTLTTTIASANEISKPPARTAMSTDGTKSSAPTSSTSAYGSSPSYSFTSTSSFSSTTVSTSGTFSSSSQTTPSSSSSWASSSTTSSAAPETISSFASTPKAAYATTADSTVAPTISVTITLPTGGTVTVAVGIDASIRDLKQILQSKEEGVVLVPFENVELLFAGQVMSDDQTIGDYYSSFVTEESVIALSYIHVVEKETSDYIRFEQAANTEGDGVASKSTSASTYAGIAVLLVVIVITVPLVAYRTAQKRKAAGRALAMNVYATRYQKDNCNSAKGSGRSSPQSTAKDLSGGNMLHAGQDPKSFFDLVFDRFDIDADPFSTTTDSHFTNVAECSGNDGIYDTAASLRKEAKGGSFALRDFAGGESDTDTKNTGGTVGRKGIFQFRMISNGNKHDAAQEKTATTTTETKKKNVKMKKKGKKKKQQKLKIGKRVLQPQWFHGDTAKPPAAVNTDGLEYDDSEMYVISTDSTLSRVRHESRLAQKSSTGYSEYLKISSASPLQDDGNADAGGIEQLLQQPQILASQQRVISPEGYEELPEIRGLPSGISNISLDQGDDMVMNMLFKRDAAGYSDDVDSSSRMASRKPNGTVGEYMDTNAATTGDFGYIDSAYMRRTDAEYDTHSNSNGPGDYRGDVGGEYLQAEDLERDTNDEYMQTDGETLRKRQSTMPLDGRMALPLNPLSLTLSPSSLPNFDDVASNLNGIGTGITGGLSAVSATEMDWVAAQWSRAKVHADGGIGTGSYAVISNPLFEDLSDVSGDDDGDL